MSYDSLLLLSFGGPEGTADVMPFLRNVVKGRNVLEERLAEVAHHYEQFGGVSPINEQNRRILGAVQAELRIAGIDLPWYWGNRNWHPMLADTLRRMHADGRRRALCFVTSAYSSYSGCRQYREDIGRAQADIGEAPEVVKLRVFYNHPDFVAANAACVQQAMATLSADQKARAVVIYTAHSIPTSMATRCRYREQLMETATLVSEAASMPRWELAFQSRSGPPSQPWLEPDILDCLRHRHRSGDNVAVVVPIGFISDHVEVLYDLDTEARALASELGITMTRAQTVGTEPHPRFIWMIRDLIEERLAGRAGQAEGRLGVSHDVCPADCCLPR